MKPYYRKSLNQTALLGVLALVALLVASGAGLAQDQCIAPGELDQLGLVGWWPGDGDVNDIGGDVADDGANVGSVPFVDGHDNQAFEFSGTSGQSVTVAEPSDELMPTSVTVDAWVKFDGLGHARYIVGKGGLYCTHASYAIYTADAACGGSLAFYVARNGLTQNGQTAPLISTDGDNGAIVCASADISENGLNLVGDGQYHFVTGTYDETTGVAKLYVDGVLVGDSDANGGDYPTQNTPLPIYDVSQSVNGSTLFTLWDDTTTPAVASANDSGPIELGVKFQADVDGFVHGVRFYKGTNNLGTHVGSLWNSDGTLLASATFTNETASGWQQVLFAAPVAVTANTTYIASYFAPQGGYAFDSGYFGTSWYRLPLTATSLAGAYNYSSESVFPDEPSLANYWVDLLFSTEAGSDDLTIGSYAEPDACIPVGLPFNGDVDEVEIFNRALSDNEIWDLYTKGKCKDGGVEPSIEKVLDSGDDPIGIYKTEATPYTFTITYTNEAQDFPVIITDIVRAEFEITDQYLYPLEATATFSQNLEGSATHIAWTIPAETDCSEGCTLTVNIETVLNPGKAKKGETLYKPTSCGPLPINDGATAFEDVGVIGAYEPLVDVDLVVGPSNPLVVQAVGDEEAGATKACEVPHTVSGVTVDDTGIETGVLIVSWDANGDAALTGYNIYRDSVLLDEVDVSTLSYTDTGLTYGMEYCYEVRAVNPVGESTDSKKESQEACALAP